MSLLPSSLRAEHSSFVNMKRRGNKEADDMVWIHVRSAFLQTTSYPRR